MSKEKENFVDIIDDAKDVKIKSKSKKRPDIQLYQPRGARIALMQSIKKELEKTNSEMIQNDQNLSEKKERKCEAKYVNNEVNNNKTKNIKQEEKKRFSKDKIKTEKSKENDIKQERVDFDEPKLTKENKKLNINIKTDRTVNKLEQTKKKLKNKNEINDTKHFENNTICQYNKETQLNTKPIKSIEINQPITSSTNMITQSHEDISETPSSLGKVRGLIKLPSELFKNNFLGQVDNEDNNRSRINSNSRNKRRNDNGYDLYSQETSYNGGYANSFVSDNYYNRKIKDRYDNNNEERYDNNEDVSTIEKINSKTPIQQNSVAPEVLQMLSKCMMLQTQINKSKESIKQIQYQHDNANRKNNNENSVKITIITKNNEHMIGKKEECVDDGDVVYDKRFNFFEKLSSLCMSQMEWFREILLKCPENVFEWKVLDLMWKDGVLPVVDSYKDEMERINTNTMGKHDTRRWCDDEVDVETYHRQLSSCFNHHLHQSTKLYSSLYDELSSIKMQENDASRKQRLFESIRYRICLSIGDLFRYKLVNLTKAIKNSNNNNNNNSNNNNNNKEIYQFYLEAQKWYMEAQKSSTSHRPYEYLARLAFSMNKNLDVFYYSIRSISLSSPAFNTPSYLISLFQGVFKTAHVEEKNRKERIQNERKKNNIKKKHHFVFGHRSEIWYSSDGCRKVDESSEEEDEEDDPLLKTHDQMKIYQLFQLDFLNLHGKLYNKINLDTLEDNWNHLIKEFTYLMNTHPIPLSQQKLVQVITITIFSISQCSHNRPLQETVVKYGMMMYECLCSCFTQYLASFICQDEFYEDINRNEEDSLASKLLSIIENEKNSDGTDNRHDDEATNNKRNLTSFIDKLNTTLAPISVWSDWMMSNYHIWATVPLATFSTNKTPKENEQSFIRIFNALLKIPLESYVGSRSHDTFNGVDVTLAEDKMLYGFSPLASAAVLQSDVVASEKFSVNTRGMLVRLHKLKLLSDFMYGLEPPSLTYHPSSHQYSLILHPSGASNQSHQSHDNTTFSENSIANSNDNIGYKKFKSKYEDDEEDDDDVDYDMDDVVSTRTAESKIKSWADYDEKDPFGGQLSKKMEELRVKKEALEKQWHKNNRSKKVFDQSKSRSLLVEVRPYHLIFDTNCYIAYLHAIKIILLTQKFCIVVPLVVIQELDYLALNGRVDADAEWNEHLKNQASKAIKFLEDEFEKKSCRIKAITSKGSIMDSIMFRCEDLDVALGRNNDDKILNCCLHFIRDKPADYMPENPDDPLKLARSVVLLTDDKNLRGKAHVQNVPVKTVTWFMKWSRS